MLGELVLVNLCEFNAHNLKDSQEKGNIIIAVNPKNTNELYYYVERLHTVSTKYRNLKHCMEDILYIWGDWHNFKWIINNEEELINTIERGDFL